MPRYESTRDAINALYPRVARDGIVLVDDYGSYTGCRKAIDEYRAAHRITAPMTKVWERYPKRQNKGGARHDYKGWAFESVWWRKRPS